MPRWTSRWEALGAFRGARVDRERFATISRGGYSAASPRWSTDGTDFPSAVSGTAARTLGSSHFLTALPSPLPVGKSNQSRAHEMLPPGNYCFVKTALKPVSTTVKVLPLKTPELLELSLLKWTVTVVPVKVQVPESVMG